MHIDFYSPETIEEQLRKEGFSLNERAAELESVREAIRLAEKTVASVEEVRRMRFRLSNLVDRAMAPKKI